MEALEMRVGPETAEADRAAGGELERDTLLQMIAADGTTFQHIILFNCIEAGQGADTALERMKDFHDNLLTFHGLLTGFQFLGIQGTGSTDGTIQEVALFLLALGFCASALGSLVSFVAVEYCLGLRGESDSMVTHGILRYWRFFYLSDLSGFASTLCFTGAVNVLIHSTLPDRLSFIINGLTLVAVPIFMFFYIRIVPLRQSYGGGRVMHKFRLAKHSHIS
jgi:hypothetical protein